MEEETESDGVGRARVARSHVFNHFARSQWHGTGRWIVCRGVQGGLEVDGKAEDGFAKCFLLFSTPAPSPCFPYILLSLLPLSSRTLSIRVWMLEFFVLFNKAASLFVRTVLFSFFLFFLFSFPFFFSFSPLSSSTISWSVWSRFSRNVLKRCFRMVFLCKPESCFVGIVAFAGFVGCASFAIEMITWTSCYEYFLILANWYWRY